MQWNKLFAVLLISIVGIIPTVYAQTNTSSNILVEHGEVTVTEEDFNYILNIAIPEESRQAFLKDQTKVRRLIADIFVTRSLAHQARQIGLDSDDEMQFKIAFQQDKLLMDEALNYYEKNAEKPDYNQIAYERYKAEKENYTAPEKVKASHILIKATDDRSKEEAEDLAETLRKKIIGNSAEFEKLATEFSDDPSAATNKGDLGYFARTSMVKPFADAAFAMQKEGELSEVIETQFGYHIIRFEGRKPSRQYTFDEVKDRLIEQEMTKFRSTVRTKKIEEIRLLEGIEVSQEAISKLSAEGSK